MKRFRRGYIQVYTGNGKGKTTAALGLALRSWGHGFKVCIIQFMKGSGDCGECKAGARLGKRLVIKQFGRGCFIKGSPGPKDRRLAKAGLEFAEGALRSCKYDLVVLDEINCALKWNLIKDSEVKELLRVKHPTVEVVLTGRYAPQWLIKKADIVTDMRQKKHYFEKKVPSRCGIEY